VQKQSEEKDTDDPLDLFSEVSYPGSPHATLLWGKKPVVQTKHQGGLWGLAVEQALNKTTTGGKIEIRFTHTENINHD